MDFNSRKNYFTNRVKDDNLMADQLYERFATTKADCKVKIVNEIVPCGFSVTKDSMEFDQYNHKVCQQYSEEETTIIKHW